MTKTTKMSKLTELQTIYLLLSTNSRMMMLRQLRCMLTRSPISSMKLRAKNFSFVISVLTYKSLTQKESSSWQPRVIIDYQPQKKSTKKKLLIFSTSAWLLLYLLLRVLARLVWLQHYIRMNESSLISSLIFCRSSSNKKWSSMNMSKNLRTACKLTRI